MYLSTHKPFKLYLSFYSAKSSKIYRCWIVWDRNIRVVIIPSFLAVVFLGPLIHLHLISRFQFISSSYLASVRLERRHLRLDPGDCNKFRADHGRERPGDGLDSVQDPQCVLRI